MRISEQAALHTVIRSHLVIRIVLGLVNDQTRLGEPSAAVTAEMAQMQLFTLIRIALGQPPQLRSARIDQPPGYRRSR